MTELFMQAPPSAGGAVSILSLGMLLMLPVLLVVIVVLFVRMIQQQSRARTYMARALDHMDTVERLLQQIAENTTR